MWNSLSGNAKFSIIAFVITVVLGLISMGALGLVLYYPVSFLFKKYPTLNEWRGDWVWPAAIAIGMFWSLGFAFGGVAWHYLGKYTSSKIMLYSTYLFLLWTWAAVLWFITLKNNM